MKLSFNNTNLSHFRMKNSNRAQVESNAVTSFKSRGLRLGDDDALMYSTTFYYLLLEAQTYRLLYYTLY